MTKEDLEIGIALSGGGVRAAVFHLGVLGRMASDTLLEKVTSISTVSGGTLGTGLVYSIAGNRWPESETFLNICYPKTKEYLTTTNIMRDGIARLFTPPFFFLQKRAKLISKIIQKCWDVSGKLRDLPKEPRWHINATSFESGKSWRFIPQGMGDYILNYTDDRDFLLADAMAASAAYPGFIGPLTLRTKKYSWFKFSERKKEPILQNIKKIHLYDGGIYDNLGVEPIFKIQGENRYPKNCNFLIVSDASQRLGLYTPKFYRNLLRLVYIALDQVRSLRSRILVTHFQENRNTGAYLNIGNTANYILSEAGMPEEEINVLARNSLSQDDAITAAKMKTTLRQLTEEEFDQLYRHGWEVADYTLLSRCPTLFQHTEF